MIIKAHEEPKAFLGFLNGLHHQNRVNLKINVII